MRRTLPLFALVLSVGLLGACAAAPAPVPLPAAPALTSTPAPTTSVSPPATSPSMSSSAPVEEVVPNSFLLTVEDGALAGSAITRMEVPLGETVSLTVLSDAADELHVHGYDETLELVPGESATLSFVVDIPGVFEVELHDSGLALSSLQVS